MTQRALLVAAFHAYAAGALFYLAHLVRPHRLSARAARLGVALGFVLHGVALLHALLVSRGLLLGLEAGLSGLGFLLMAIALYLDLRYRAPVLGAFLVPAALLVQGPALSWAGVLPPVAERAPLLPVHVAVALVGMASFGVAAGVACLYLLLEREVKAKRFGLLFSRLPSLELLDDLNRRLVVLGFIALSIAAVTGVFFARAGGRFWAWDVKQIITLLAWGVFAGVLNARLFAGWRGKRVALLTVGGFGAVAVVFLTSYAPAVGGGS